MIKRIASVFIARLIPAAGVILLTLFAPLASSVEHAADFLIGITFLYLLGIVARLGLDTYIVKSSASRFKQKVMSINSQELMFFLFCFSFSSLISAFGFIVSSHYGMMSVYKWVFYAVPAFACQGLFSSYLKGVGEEFWGSISEPSVSSLIALVVFLFLQAFGNFDLQFAYLSSVWLVFVITIVYIWIGCSFFKSKMHDRQSIGESFFYFLNQASSYATQWYPLFLLGGMDKKLVVYYAVANRLATVISFVGVTIDSFSAPRFSNYWKEERKCDLQKLRLKMIRLSSFLSFFCFVFISAFAFIYGKMQSFDSEYSFMVLALISSYALAVGLGPNGYYLIMTDFGGYVTKISFLVFLIVFAVSTFFYMVEMPILMAVFVGVAVLTRSCCFFFTARKV